MGEPTRAKAEELENFHSLASKQGFMRPRAMIDHKHNRTSDLRNRPRPALSGLVPADQMYAPLPLGHKSSGAYGKNRFLQNFGFFS